MALEFRSLVLHIDFVTDERFEQGILEFNAERFFEAHEVWEDLWQEYRQADRVFYQGLIHAAAALYHVQSGNRKGARSQLTKGIRKLTPFAPAYAGIDITRFLDRLERTRELIEHEPAADPPMPRIERREQP